MSKKNQIFSSKYSPVFLIIFTLAAILRIYKLGGFDLWYDEATWLSRWYLLGEKELKIYFFKILKLENAWFFYLLELLWRNIFGDTEFSLRFLPFVFGLLSIIFIYKLAKLLLNERVGLISSFIFAISPLHIWYSQEARGYSMGVFIFLLTVYFYLLALKKNKNYLWWGFIITFTLAIYTQYLSLILFPLSFLVLLFSKNKRYLFKKWLISIMLVFIYFFPLLIYFINNFIIVKFFFWTSKKLLWQQILIVLGNFFVGYNATKNIFWWSFILFLFLYLLGLLALKKYKEETIFLLLFSIIPIFSLFLFSRCIMNIFLSRQLMVFSPFFYILIAKGIEKISFRLLKFITLFLIVIFISFSLYNYYNLIMPLPQIPYHYGVHLKKPIKHIAEFVNKNKDSTDIVLHTHPSLPPLFLYYLRSGYEIGKYIIAYTPFKLTGYWSLFYESIKQKNKIPNAILISKEDIEELKNQYHFKKIWLISASWDRKGYLDPESQAIRDLMDKNYPKLFSTVIDGIYIDLYKIED